MLTPRAATSDRQQGEGAAPGDGEQRLGDQVAARQVPGVAAGIDRRQAERGKAEVHALADLHTTASERARAGRRFIRAMT